MDADSDQSLKNRRVRVGAAAGMRRAVRRGPPLDPFIPAALVLSTLGLMAEFDGFGVDSEQLLL
jgi:hypothetical protein